MVYSHQMSFLYAFFANNIFNLIWNTGQFREFRSDENKRWKDLDDAESRHR